MLYNITDYATQHIQAPDGNPLCGSRRVVTQRSWSCVPWGWDSLCGECRSMWNNPTLAQILTDQHAV